jgi:hypothetical protein
VDGDRLDEIALNARIQEANNLGERLRGNMKTIDEANNLGLAIVTAGVAFGVSQNRPLVIVLMPIVLLLVVVHCVQTFTELLMMGGQRRCLEELLHTHVGQYVMFSESVIAPLRGRAVDLAMKQGLYGLVLLALIGFGIWQAQENLEWPWLVAYLCALGYGLVTLGVSLRKMTTAYADAYSAASAVLLVAPDAAGAADGT